MHQQFKTEKLASTTQVGFELWFFSSSFFVLRTKLERKDTTEHFAHLKTQITDSEDWSNINLRFLRSSILSIKENLRIRPSRENPKEAKNSWNLQYGVQSMFA
jgi:hypothetical protein